MTDRETALYYIKTFSETVREPFLILDSGLRIIGANPRFYRDFRVLKEQTENQLIYELGDGQWDIPELRELLEKILPDKKALDDYEVSHDFPLIGPKVMLLNARQLDSSQIILVAIEDITLKRQIEVDLAAYTNNLKKAVGEKTRELQVRVDELTKLSGHMEEQGLEMSRLKKENEELRKGHDG